jgi:hypothetical protein
MPGKSVAQVLEKDLPVSFTDKPVTAWGGLSPIARFFKKIGLADLLGAALPNLKISNNQIPAVEIVLAFFVGVLRGASRFAHVAFLRMDQPLQALFGFSRPPSAASVTRFFGAFRRLHVETLWQTLVPWTLARLPAPRWGHTLDLDSTVFVRYGQQQGAAKGYNPKKPGRKSHHPLVAFLAEAKLVLHVWLRSGNCATARGVVEFLKEALALMPDAHKLYAVRADSGFCEKGFLDFLEARQLPYAVAARFTRTVQRLVGHQVKTWRPFGHGLEAGETFYQALGWKAPRRLVVVRELIHERKEARGRKLFDLPGYTFHALVTDLDWPPETVWRFYNSRADAENRIKELAELYHAKSFCLNRFDGAEAALRLVCFLFNLIALFKQIILKRTDWMLPKLQTALFAVGAFLGMENGKPILRLARTGPLRDLFQRLLDRLETLTPTASQSVLKRATP